MPAGARHIPLARAMVLHDRKWFLPDRATAEFTGEPASEVNRRAQDRNGLALEKGDRLQVIDFACHLDRQRQKGGHGSQLYSRETALALLGLTTNFTGAWTKETAIDALNQASDWVATVKITRKINLLDISASAGRLNRRT